jgi:hypothetical protein
VLVRTAGSASGSAQRAAAEERSMSLTYCPKCGDRDDRACACLNNIEWWQEAFREVSEQQTESVKRLLALLQAVGDPGKCKGCGVPIYWVLHRNGKRAPYTLNGLNHFADCPAADRFRGSR